MRTFAVVTIADVQPLVNAAGAAVIANARKSLDGTQMILDFNHHEATIAGMFNVGVDVPAAIAGCQMYDHEAAKLLMASSLWHVEEVL